MVLFLYCVQINFQAAWFRSCHSQLRLISYISLFGIHRLNYIILKLDFVDLFKFVIFLGPLLLFFRFRLWTVYFILMSESEKYFRQ